MTRPGVARMLALACLVLAVACSKSATNAPPAEVWTVAEYTTAGVPDPARPWTVNDHVTASLVLVREAALDEARLPRFHGPKSGAVFARLCAPLVDDPAATLGDRLGAHVVRYQATNDISKLYMTKVLAPTSREYIELLGTMFDESVAVEQQFDPFLASFAPDDPSLERRREGRVKAARGWGEMLTGALMIANDLRVPEPDRTALMTHLTRALPTLYPRVSPETQRDLRERLVALEAALPVGPLRDATTVAVQALPR